MISKKETIQKIGFSEEKNNTNNVYISKTKKVNRHILNDFYSAVDSREFYDLAEAVLAEIEDPDDVVKCAEVASKRQPGGAFYRAKLWAKTSFY